MRVERLAMVATVHDRQASRLTKKYNQGGPVAQSPAVVSALGQKPTYAVQWAECALLPKADM